MQELLQLSPAQLEGIRRARQNLQAGFMAIARQRLQDVVQPLSNMFDRTLTGFSLAPCHLLHLEAHQRSQALFTEESLLFMAFADEVYQVSWIAAAV